LQIYLGIHDNQLRFFTPEGALIPTPEESAELEREQAEVERQQLEAERQRNAKLAAKLRELGVNPDEVM
jgi:hypothetical protein